MKKFLIFAALGLLSCINVISLSAGEPHKHQQDNCCVAPLKCLQYGAFFTKRECEVKPQHAIHFDHQDSRVFPTSGIRHEHNSSKFVISSPGIYRVIYSVSLEDKGRVALTLDDNIIPGSEMYIGQDKHLSTLTVLVNICDIPCDSILQVINNNAHSSSWHNHDITLKSADGNVTAAIDIEKIAECHKPCCFECKRNPCECINLCDRHDHDHDHDRD
jgi:hypothetical protein